SWQVGLMPLKFLDSDGIGDTAAAVAAIDYAIDNGARVINASWGRGSYSVALRRAVEHAAERGVLFVAAAGNSLPGKDNDQIPFFPAS
ncbi:MAG: S8 family serine peptidase, partial [Actinobacteria bacterium]|nr:S8 family serine peptidase [Actinomycetota bacterium]NIS31040.1 S8 family serine peptidase [Actinomycetota bacterium]NIT95449.1 S8 family serine peptidase [Actinomycetota bacterium]NIU19136.1 S8 family serine peptidase [Actinomycetota bacterium]NIV55621.1 S8 family serine peptidase [Actinomycetota bacterium]